MNWTTEKPIVPGWYWYRGGSDGHTVKVLHFIDDDGEGPYLATSDDVALTDLDGDWAGPVEPPLSGQSRLKPVCASRNLVVCLPEAPGADGGFALMIYSPAPVDPLTDLLVCSYGTTRVVMTETQAAALREKWKQRVDPPPCKYLNQELEWDDLAHSTGHYTCIICGNRLSTNLKHLPATLT